MSESLSVAMAEFVAKARYQDLSAEAVRMTKFCLLDAIGVSMAATRIGEGCDTFIDLAKAYGGEPRCSILGTTHKVPPEAAALANGALAHALDYEDSHDGALVHPNAPTIPAALAAAQAHGPVSGRDLITAIAVGCDVVVRMGLGLKVTLADFGWYPPPMLAAFGATAAAAKILKLNERQVRDAFTLTLCQMTCAGEIMNSPQSTLRAVRDAFPARGGISSALLARGGVRGFDKPLEGEAGFYATFARGNYEPAAITRDLGKEFEIENISFKPWPSCRGTHAPIEAALHCLREYNIDPDEIERIHVRGGRMLRIVAEPRESKRRPATAIDAKFSAYFTVATALLKRRVTLHDFEPSALKDERILALASKVDVDMTYDPTPNAIGALLEINMKNGTKHRYHVDEPLGAPSNPMSPDAIVAKFVDCAGYAAAPLAREAAQRYAQVVLKLEELNDIDAQLFSARFAA